MKIIVATILLPFASAIFGNDSILEELQRYGLFNSYDIPTLPYPVRGTYDFIVVGAGSGGSTVANRLSENGNWHVLLLEAGKPEGLLNQIPMITSLFASTDYNWGYKVEPQKNACHGMTNDQCTWPRGKSLGGSSTLNYMLHTRGNKLDYDGWAAMGNNGWSYAEVLPYFKKSEKFNIKEFGTANYSIEYVAMALKASKSEKIANTSYHGTDGYLNVESVPFRTPLATEFINAAVKLGYKYQEDYNGAEQEGVAYFQVDMEKGTRCSASKAYLSIKRPNLEIVPRAHVIKVLINEKNKAYGVEYVLNGLTRRVYATKEVILSAGTIDSAKLLMLSGIGPKEHLQELGIPVLKDSKVGYNLYEHIGFLGPTFMVNQSVTVLSSRLLGPSAIFQYAAGRTGPLSLPGGAESVLFRRTKYARDARPDLEILFAAVSFHSDNGLGEKRSHGVSDEFYDTVFKPIEGKDAFMVWPINEDPLSYGRLTLRSKNPFEAPIIEPNFFENPKDVEVILEGVKIAIEMSKTEYFQAYGTRLLDIKFPGCESYEFNTDDYWRCCIRTLPSMMNHEIGTCKMGPASDPDAVVDPELKVYGIQRLRVVDASIMPKLIVGHTNAPVFMIGEKAADMIKQTWQKEY